MKEGYREVWNLKSYRKVLIANFINRLGDSIDMIAFAWLSYQVTNSASWVAIIYAVNNLPTILFMPFVGALVEKLKKKWIIIGADLSRGILTAVIVLLYRNNSLSIEALLIITFVNNTLECFRIPAGKGLLPLLLEHEQYEHGLALEQSVTKITEVIGIGLSGALIGTIGIQGAIMIDCVSFFLCAIILFTLKIQEPAIQKSNFTFSAYVSTLKEGCRFILQNPFLKSVILCCVCGNALFVPLNSYDAAYISGTLHQSATLYSITSLAMSLGMTVGSFLFPILHQRFSARSLFLYLFYSLSGYYLMLFLLPHLTSVLLLTLTFTLGSLIFGLCMGISLASINISIMKNIDPAYMSRVSSMMNAVNMAAMPVTSFALSAIALVMDLPMIFLFFSIFTFILITGMMSLKILYQM